ncbi:NAD-dependent epimerase/dehydratase family protein [Bacillus sp. FJAT-49736]|uniref:NAD-dependent epimerase/dehydratase family protein n=1 Tax=Bacillus sp. FJAT-49736 TaxID=2833582 RepID=UPI001BC91F8F|nr:NAD-dependent epimerase/dehydratase family protein [Bacillus sp. FJAT-49736]MBS4171720.1 NAD-dependent epimerase/dehydratase family protein [Bacillus sp. FJAT-49736]
MNILIIGGTRFLGPYVTKQLVELEHDVTIFHRGQTNCTLPDSVNEIIGDRKNLKDLRQQIEHRSFDVVVDMFPYIEQDAIDVIEFFSDVTKRFVALSSADVYQAYGRLIGIEKGDFTTDNLTEESPVRAVIYPYRGVSKEDDWRYHYDKILVEQQFMKKSPVPSTVLRLPMIYGPNDRQFRLSQYLKTMKTSDEINLHSTEAKWRTSRGFVENVAYAITLAIVNPKAANQIYNVAEDFAFTELEWVKTIKEHYKWDGQILVEDTGVASDGFNPEQHLVISSKKIRTELGYKEIVPFEEGIQQTISWELENAPE